MNWNKDTIKALRARKGLTQMELAIKLKMSLAAVQKWEGEENLPSHLACEKLDRISKRK